MLNLLRGKGEITLNVQKNKWDLYQKDPLYINLIRESSFIRAFPTDMGGGIAGGDSQEMKLYLQSSRMLWQPAASTLCYPNRGEDESVTELNYSIIVQDKSILIYLNKPLIPCQGSWIEQSIDVNVDESSELLYFEPYSSGRIAYGQEWAFKQYRNKFVLNYKNQPVLKESWQLLKNKIPRGPAGFKGYSHWATLISVGTEIQTVLNLMIQRLEMDQCFVTQSIVCDNIRLVRVLDKTGVALNMTFQDLAERHYNSIA